MFDQEFWRSMISDDRYEVSDQGRVRRIANKRIRKPSKTPRGYEVIVLSRPGSSHFGVYVHREVIMAFIGPCPSGAEVSHLNGNNADNRLANLCYESHLSNVRRKRKHGTQTSGEDHKSAKLKWSEVRAIRNLLENGASLKELSARYGVSYQQISRIGLGHNWRESCQLGKLEP